MALVTGLAWGCSQKPPYYEGVPVLVTPYDKEIEDLNRRMNEECHKRGGKWIPLMGKVEGKDTLIGWACKTVSP